MTVRAVGTGGGGRDTPDRPNITRVVIGASGAERDLREGDVTVVESTVDDLDPRLWPSVLQAVRAAGAWDCWCTPIVGRHGRPGQVLTALCAEPVFSAVAAAIFAHTGTLGVRWSRMNRLTASRTSVRGGSGTAGQQPGRYGQGGRHRRWPRGLRNGHGRVGRGGSRRPGPGLAGAGRLRGRRRAVPRPGSSPTVTPPLRATADQRPESAVVSVVSGVRRGARGGGRDLAGRAAGAGMFGVFLAYHSNGTDVGRAVSYRYGCEPDPTPAPPWRWAPPGPPAAGSGLVG